MGRCSNQLNHPASAGLPLQSLGPPFVSGDTDPERAETSPEPRGKAEGGPEEERPFCAMAFSLVACDGDDTHSVGLL